jgi:AcrR family transcriptional regulator
MGRPAQINRTRILDAALAIADADGLDAVTMHAVAKRLGVTAMALYRHVEDKKDLLDGLVERLLTSLPLPPPDLTLDERLAAVARNMRATAAGHPNVFPLLLQRPADTPAALAVRDAVVAALGEAGLDGATAARMERLLSTAVLGFAVSEVAGRFAHHDRAVLDADFDYLLEALRRMIDSAGD